MTIFKGKDETAAIEKAVKQLAATKDQLEIKVLQTAHHGFLGIGLRPAKIKVTLRKENHNLSKSVVDNDKPHEENVQPEKTTPEITMTPEEKLQKQMAENHQHNLAKVKTAMAGLTDYLIKIYQQLGITVEPRIQEVKVHHCEVNLETEHPGQVVGYHGRRINAIEQLGVAFLNYHGVREVELILNTGDYREKRRATLDKLMERSVTQVIATGQAVFLDPMPARERKYLHKLAEQHAEVRTYSHGREPFRSIVIAPQN